MCISSLFYNSDTHTHKYIYLQNIYIYCIYIYIYTEKINVKTHTKMLMVVIYRWWELWVMIAYLICENFLSTCNIFCKKNKYYYIFKIDKVLRKDPEGCYSYLWSDTCSFIQQINFNSVVSVIEWLNDTYRIHYHYGKKKLLISIKMILQLNQ